jgi:anti-sigma-K factor RskA
MTWRAPAIVALAATSVLAAGCGGNGDGGGGGETAGGGACGTAKSELLNTVSERDRLFVDLQLDKATKACEDELEADGTTERCTAARADLEAAAAEETPPPDLDARVDAAVEACVGTTITSTIPAP